MIFRLEYKNKALKTARVDIITPTGTGVETVEGTGYPFMLKYEGDKKNKGLMFLSSSAEINIYETPLFNIDTLKTSGEKDIRVNYYIDSVLEWTGFVIPDFFSREIGGDGVVSMVASDRLSVLDSEVLDGLPVTVTLRTLLSLSLAKTGLTLPLKTVVDFATVSGNTNHVLNHSIRSQRLTDTKGRSVNCKDIIKSILVATNSKLMQRKGEWWVINKMQHELGSGRVYTSPTAFTNYVEDLISFTDVTRGAMRTIAPVAGGVGVFQEYGGGALAPANYAFESGLSGWTLHNGFTASTNNRRVLGYTQSGSIFTPIYDDAGTSGSYLVNRNLHPSAVVFPSSQWDPYAIKSIRTVSPVISSDSSTVKITIDVNATGRNGTLLPFTIALKRPGHENLFLNRDNEWQPRAISQLLFFKNEEADTLAAVTAGMSISATITAASSGEVLDDVGTYTIEVLIFGSGIQQGSGEVDYTTLINSASVQFIAASNDTPKGTLYKADQGGGSYTKIHDTETTVFGDYLTGGLNGYFYNYAPDDTSSLLAPNGSRSQPAWVNTFTQNTEPLPLLQQTIRQMRRMFSVAHDFIKGEIDVADFDPLSIFEDCERRFVIVEAEFDFLRGSLQVVLEEVAYQNLTVREYIYSYFGEGDEGIRGISGISAGSSGGGGGGGMAPEPSWLENEITIDPESGLLSVDGWHVKGNLIIEGQVNQWLAQQLVVDDARIQVNRRQGGATVDSGLVIHDRDTGLEVSRLVYDVSGIWQAGGQRIFTDDYNPMLGGYSAASYPRKAENAVITGAWTFSNSNFNSHLKLHRNALRGSITLESNGGMMLTANETPTSGNSITITPSGNVGFGILSPTERLHVAGNGLFTGNITAQGNLSAVNAALSGTLDVTGATTLTGAVTAGGTLAVTGATTLKNTLAVTAASTFGGNVGTSNFASQLQGWRVTPQGQADFRHIYTDELQAKAFTADISQALVGSDVLTKSVAKLAQNFTVTANGTTAPLYVEELEGFAGMQVFAVNDILLIRIFDRSGGGLLIKNVWVEVVSYVGTTDNVQQFTVNVINSGGIAGQMAYAGSMILDYGQSGSGLIQRTVLDQQGSPYSRVTTWVNNPWTPENFTLHYQSGNLNGLANAEGWGVYSQNSFLTGKLLVGDLTKQGQYMEYENGELNIKGQITVTGGNAATKEDVDAVQVGGRNLFFKSGFAFGTSGNAVTGWGVYGAQGLSVSQDKPITIPGVNTISWELSAGEGGYYQRFRSPDGSSVTDYFQQGQRYTVSAWLKASAPSTFRIRAEGVPGGTALLSLTTEWQLYTHTFVGDPIRHTVAFYGGTQGVRYYLCMPKLELGNRATDWTPAPEDVDAGIAAAAASTSALATRVENTLGLAQLEGINQTLITGGKVRTALLEATEIKSLLITAENIEGLTLNFTKGKIGGWNIDSTSLSKTANNQSIALGAISWTSINGFHVGSSGINRVSIGSAPDGFWGIYGANKGGLVFQLGSINQIAGINFDDSRIFTQNWELNKDGSGNLAGGKISWDALGNAQFDGSVITGLIQSQNWDGEKGTRINLIDGSMDYGNVIHVNANAGEISFRDLNADRLGVRLGDFDLSPAVAGASYDQNLSLRAFGGGYNWSLTRWISPLGIGANESVLTTVSQNTYNFSYPLQAALGRSFQNLFTGLILQEGYAGGLSVKVTVYLEDAIIHQSESQIPSYFGAFSQPDDALTMPVNFNFTGSGQLKVKIELTGFGGYRDYQGNQYYPTSVVSLGATTIKVTPSTSVTELSTKGFQSLWGPTKYFRVYDKVGFDNFIEARGVQQFISPNGTYRLRVSDSGIQKSTNGGQDWTTL